MPSLALWPTYWASVEPWQKGHPEVVAASNDDAWLREWTLTDAQGRPWSAARLFLFVGRQIVEQTADVPVVRARPTDEAARRDLLALVRQLIAELGQTAIARRAQRRERGVRFTRPFLAADPDGWDPRAP